jgi:hypothetical protein
MLSRRANPDKTQLCHCRHCCKRFLLPLLSPHLLLLLLLLRFDCAPAAVSCSLSVYADGSVLVSHGGIEMGQGLATKVGAGVRMLF